MAIVSASPGNCPDSPNPSTGEPPISGEFLAIRTIQTNPQPSITITTPAEGAIFEAPATIQIEALTQEPDGYFNSAEFFANDVKIGQTILTFLVAPPPGERDSNSIYLDKCRARFLHLDRAPPRRPSGARGGFASSPYYRPRNPAA